MNEVFQLPSYFFISQDFQFGYVVCAGRTMVKKSNRIGCSTGLSFTDCMIMCHYLNVNYLLYEIEY